MEFNKGIFAPANSDWKSEIKTELIKHLMKMP